MGDAHPRRPPFAAAVVIATLYLRITVLLLSLLASEVQTGYYATAFAVISVLIAIPALTVGSTLPVLSRAARDDRERLRYVLERVMEVTLIVGAGIALSLALGAHFVVQVLSGHSGGPSVTILQIESLAIVTQFVGATWQYGLLALHRHRDCLIVSAAGLIASVVLTLVLVPTLHGSGAAVALLGGEILVAGASLAFLLRVPPRMSFSLVCAGQGPAGGAHRGVGRVPRKPWKPRPVLAWARSLRHRPDRHQGDPGRASPGDPVAVTFRAGRRLAG